MVKHAWKSTAERVRLPYATRGRAWTGKHETSEESSCLRVQLKERWYTPSEAK